jgi:hypothetical protein
MESYGSPSPVWPRAEWVCSSSNSVRDKSILVPRVRAKKRHPFPPMAEYYPSSIIVDMMRHPSSSGGEASRSDRDGPAELMTA